MPMLTEVAQYIADANLAATSGSGTGWYLWKGGMPDSTAIPDRAVLVRNTGGPEPIWTLGIEQPAFQVVVRGARTVDVSSAYKEARAMAQDVRDRLHFTVGASLSGVAYPGILAEQEPFYMGEDLDQRPVFVCNYRAWRVST